MSTRINREVIAEKVAYGVIDFICENKIKPNEKLPTERELAEIFSVGRPAVREALRALHMMNIVNIRHGDGIYLSSLEPKLLINPFKLYMDLGEITLEHLFEARMLLEVEVIGLAAKRITEAQIMEIEKHIKKSYEFLEDAHEFQKADTKIHSIISDAADNPILKNIMMSIKELVDKSREITSGHRELREIVHNDHNRILEALKMKDEEACKNTMRNHLQNVKKIADLNRDFYEKEFKKILKKETFFGISD